jgi:hypothetical protein
MPVNSDSGTGSSSIDGALETIEDLPGANDAENQVLFWTQQLNLAREVTKDWEKMASLTVQKYSGTGSDKKPNQHNILWSNTETLRPALYNSTPKPDVRRRFRDADPVGKQVSEALERALSFSVDSYDFDEVVETAILDYVLPGRPIVRVRYRPHFKTIPERKNYLDPNEYIQPPLGSTVPAGGPSEISYQYPEGAELDEEQNLHFMMDPAKKLLEYEEVLCENVEWDRFLHDPCRNWNEVDWISFTHHLTRDELVANFKDGLLEESELEEMPLTNSINENASENEQETDIFKKIEVQEIWSKLDKKIYFIAESYKLSPLKIEDDNLNLKDFFPIPRPIYSVESTTNLVPIPEYTLYKDQADELDRVTARINKLIQGLRLIGVYDGTIPEVDKLKNSAENELIAAENVNRLHDIGGLKNAVFFWPIEQASSVLVNLYNQRNQLKDLIYEITGISDIMRGTTDPRETKGAQAIKANWGGQRIQRRQKVVERYVRDIMRIKAEIISEKFSPETLKAMTGREVTPEMLKIMRKDSLREFRIDVETDSTIAATKQEEQKEVVTFLKGFTEFVAGLGPAVESGYITAKASKAMALAAARRFRFGREVEDALTEMDAEGADEAQNGQKKPTSEELKQQADMQAQQADMQMKQQDAQLKQQLAQADMQMKQQAQQTEMQMKQMAQEADMQMKAEESQRKSETDRTEMMEKARLAEIEMNTKLELSEREMEGRLEIEREKAAGQLEIARYTAQNKPQPKESGK